MLTVLAWIPRLVRFFGVFQGVVGAFGSFWPVVSSLFQRRKVGAVAA